MTNTKLIINRDNQILNIFRNIEIYLDHKKIDTISNGEQKIFEIEPGERIIYIKMDWCQTMPISINAIPNREMVFNIGCTVKILTIILLIFPILLGAIIDFIFRLKYPIYIGIVITTIIAFYIVVIKSKNFLYIKQSLDGPR